MEGHLIFYFKSRCLSPQISVKSDQFPPSPTLGELHPFIFKSITTPNKRQTFLPSVQVKFPKVGMTIPCPELTNPSGLITVKILSAFRLLLGMIWLVIDYWNLSTVASFEITNVDWFIYWHGSKVHRRNTQPLVAFGFSTGSPSLVCDGSLLLCNERFIDFVWEIHFSLISAK